MMSRGNVETMRRAYEAWDAGGVDGALVENLSDPDSSLGVRQFHQDRRQLRFLWNSLGWG